MPAFHAQRPVLPQRPAARLRATALLAAAPLVTAPLVAAPVAAAWLAGACAQGPASSPAQNTGFDADRAWKDLEHLVSIGTRQAGTPGAEKMRAYLSAELSACGLKPVPEAWRQTTPVGELEFANLYVDLAPARESASAPWILFCTHYDTKRLPPLPAEPGKAAVEFVGANDGGSGTAVLLEVARALARQPRGDCGIRILFLDGEEAVNREWIDPDNRYGSRHHAAQLKSSGRAASFKACVLLDMIGDKGLRIDQEGASDARLYAPFASAARELGFAEQLTGKRGEEIIDDHRIFMEVANIRSIDLIDFEYGPPTKPGGAYWHTHEDTLEHCSKQSLDVVGRVVLKALPALEKQLTGG